MKIFKIFLSISFAFQSVYAESLAATLKDTQFLKQEGKLFSDFWKPIRSSVRGVSAAKVDQFISRNKQFQIPEISWTKLHKTESVDSGFRVILKHSRGALSIELIQDNHVAARVNGVALTHQDLKSFDAIMNKLILEVYSKENKFVGQNENLNPWSYIAWLFMGSISEAAETCQNLQEKICWDSLEGKSITEASQAFRGLARDKHVSPDEIKSYLESVSRKKNQCTSSCGKLEWQYQVLLAVSADRQKPRPVQRSGEPAPALKETAEKEMVNSFWDDNDSWLKPTLIVGGVFLATWGLCRAGIVNIFGCGDKSSDGSNTILTSTLPTATTPTAEVYTGIGTK
ncbi:MAG: hypothetical protein JNL11_09870 [Bdellovibrionaceae bacterium]|nr:hypothetical protein [Pseudobdellovibrionaceae bacterium]